MSALRIKGLVSFTDRIRSELSGPVSEVRRSQLRGEVATVIRQVDRMVADHGTHIDRLPAPSRRAYRFLATLDFNRACTEAGVVRHEAAHRPAGRTRLIGVKSFWQTVLRRLALPTSPGERSELFDSIRSTAEDIERNLQDQDTRARDLTNQSRAIRGWLLYFADRRHFDAYVAAVERAKPVFDAALGRGGRFLPPALIEFQATNALYRLRGDRDGTRVILPTPMIVFSRALFEQVAEVSVSNGSRKPLMVATTGEAYQNMLAELEALSGVEAQTAGVHRDLANSFDRVNARYFGGGMDRPRLTWSRSFTGRKFGHFDFVHDAVMISCSLDRAEVPESTLDFVMYHELLHRKLGESWRDGRATAHTPEFRRQERLFHGFDEAEAVLRKIAMGRL